MAGLVGYGSSDDEDHTEPETSKADAVKPSSESHTNGHKPEVEQKGAAVGPALPELDAPLVGPSLGPAPGEVPSLDGDDLAAPPLSPYSAHRALLRDLTLPTLPDYDIPPSPPGSPRESTNSKFKHFLELKKQGTHFNEKLARSPALKNPSLMEKLVDFAGIDEAGQYATTLSDELWHPRAFPAYAYKEELAKSQQKILKQKEAEKARGQRDGLDFVPATSTAEEPSQNGAHWNGGRPGQQSAAERIMAGLDRGRSSLPHVQGTKRKSRFDS